jgi:hypothetical protein
MWSITARLSPLLLDTFAVSSDASRDAILGRLNPLKESLGPYDYCPLITRDGQART